MLQYNILIGLMLIFLAFKYYINSNGKRALLVRMGNRKKRVDTDWCALLACSIYYFIIFSFRNYTVGIDLKNYLIRYHAFATTPFKDIFSLADSYSFEYGFAILVKSLTYISDSAIIFMLATGIIITYGFYRFIKKYSEDVIFSFFTFFTFSMGTGAMNVVRQYLAIVLLLSSIEFIEKNKFVKFAILVLLASTIHSGSIIFIVLYPLVKITKLDARFVISAIGGTIFFALFGDKLLNPIIRQTSFSWYIGRAGSGESMLVFSLVLTMLMYYLQKGDEEIVGRKKIWLDMMLLSIIFNAAALHLGLFERVMRFFYPAIIIMIPNTLNEYSSIKNISIKKWLKILLILFFVVFFYYIMCSGDGRSSGGTNPYEFMNISSFNQDSLELYNSWYH